VTKVMQIDEKNVNFLKKVEELSGEKITLCEQCGICTTSCPMVDEMDFTPAGIMRAVQIGDETIIESKAIWVCASCFSCTVRCPRGIDLSKVTEALRQLTLRKNVDHIDLKEVKKEKLPAIAVVSALRKFTG